MKLMKWEDFEVNSHLFLLMRWISYLVLMFTKCALVNTGQGNWSLAFQLHTVISMEAHSFRFVKALLLRLLTFSILGINSTLYLIAATGYTEYYFNEKSGKVCRHIEHWNVPKMALLKQIIQPSRGRKSSG